MALTETPLAALAITIQEATVMRSINLARSVNGIFKTAESVPRLLHIAEGLENGLTLPT